jgi:hypothetical protein
LIENENKLIDVYGYFPEFCDGEILSVNISRSVAGNSAAKVVLKLYYSEAKSINQGTVDFEIVKDKETITTLEFYEIEKFELMGFSYQNVIDSLVIAEKGGVLEVLVTSSFGASLSFLCKLARVCEVRIYA